MKGLKHTTGIILLLLCISIGASAQKKITGIYRTLNDYLNKQLSYISDGNSTPVIKLYSLVPKSYVTIQHKGEQLHLNKNEIFAYQLTNGEVYRIIGNHSYLVLNNHPQLLLYKRKIPTSPKEGPEQKFKYYFSANNGNVQTLTAWNVKQAFADHPTLPDQIDVHFKKDTELLTYDTFHKMYKLEKLLAISF
ncbi:hypothetical protein ACTJJ0_33290 [Chitinophaga sp. 22321]|uniref:Outer membrane lipoprotein-sorting protein n=1 Tax=Chitinophaga hostae TaxID=2831022 RepID=A0ABS5J9X4_9BACT|nr:hypothetical protein [Chitinophaga hostae]MBS0032002.1 hypothetical protein [Chitinophaga hostae]